MSSISLNITSTEDPRISASDSSEGSDDNDESFTFIAAGLGGAIFLVIVGTAIWWCKCRKVKKVKKHVPGNTALVERQKQWQRQQHDDSEPTLEHVFAEMDPEGGMNTVENPTFTAPSTKEDSWGESAAVSLPDTRGNDYEKDTQQQTIMPSHVTASGEPVWLTEMTRKDATALLQHQPNGSFVVRPSTSATSGYCVTCVVEGAVKNYTIWKDPFGYSFPKSNNKFPTIAELIEAAVAGPLDGFPVQLLLPVAPAVISATVPGNYDAVEIITLNDAETKLNGFEDMGVQEGNDNSDGYGIDTNPSTDVEALAADATRFLLGLESGDVPADGSGYLDTDNINDEAEA